MANMPAARFADLCTGHGCYPPRPNIQGSPDVFINDRAAHRQTDAWAPHCCPKRGCHGAVTVSGSATVSVNDLEAARIKDPVSCGSVIMTGSTDVIIGD